MLRKKVDKYVDRVVRYLPLIDRRKARVIITSAIYARLDDLTEGMKPTKEDLRLILKEMGHPGILAEAYYKDFHKTFEETMSEKINKGKFLHGFIMVLTAIALILIVQGLAELIVGVGSMHGFAIGLVLGVIVVIYQMLVQSKSRVPITELFD